MERELTQEETERILSIQEKDITEDLLLELFSRQGPDKDPEFNTSDYFVLPVGACCNNSKKGFTTIGIYLFNRFIIEPHFVDLIGYYNDEITAPHLEEIEDILAKATYNDKMDTDSYADYLDRIQWLGGNAICPIITPSITPGLLKPPPGLNELKKKLMEENKDAIKAGDVITGAKIEQELISYAADKLKDDPGFENFASKAKVTLDNNYKTMNIMKGPLQNNSTGEYQINFSDYNSGVTKDEYASIADSAVAGAYSRSTAVAVGGYLAKRSHQTLNTVEAGPHGSDCGTKEYLTIYLDEFFEQEYLYRYIIDESGTNKKLVLLTEENFSKYVNTTVKMRSPMFCHMESPYFCNKCLGEQPYMLGLTKFGLAIARASNTLLNLQLKKFHAMNVKLSTIDENRILNFKDKDIFTDRPKSNE